MATVTNIVPCNAPNGQNVVVTLGTSDTTNVLPTLTVGQKCTNGSSTKIGYISEIDTFGRTFRINTQSAATNFASTAPRGTLATSESITIV